MKESSKKVLHIITPFIVCLICLGVFIVTMIKPYDKVKVYLNLAFMDDFKINPDGSTRGLVIRENEIKEDFSGETDETGEIIRPQFAELYAIIKSDSFSVDVPVYWGSDSELFERGACQSSSSVVIGEDGNSVISAHEDTFFSELSSLTVGDVITINTNYGQFTYKVKELIEFNKDNDKYVVPSEETKLTLYTCKKDILGSPDGRVGVICELTKKKFYTGEVQE
ncbi:MAG: class D sortase [Ruminococcus flavefaciens]|nr:class D sortase [Ruminococcus flavefaciens]